MLVKIYLCTMLLGFLSFDTKTYDTATNQQITVTGKALNVKDGAVVETDKGVVYTLDGSRKWDEQYYGKKVQVTGWLKIKRHKKSSTESREVQERVGTWLIITRPTWKLVE